MMTNPDTQASEASERWPWLVAWVRGRREGPVRKFSVGACLMLWEALKDLQRLQPDTHRVGESFGLLAGILRSIVTCGGSDLDPVAADVNSLADRLDGVAAPNITATESGRLQVVTALAHVRKVEAIISRRLDELEIYLVEEVGTLPASLLVGGVDGTIREELQEDLPKRVIKDLNEAGRCLAFGRPTACGFHAGRAVDLALSDFLEKTSLPSALPVGMTFGVGVDEFSQHLVGTKVRPVPDKQREAFTERQRKAAALAEELFYLKEKRNAYTHPQSRESDLTTDKAVSLLHRCIDAIRHLAEESLDREFSTPKEK